MADGDLAGRQSEHTRGRWLAVFALFVLVVVRGADPWPVEGLRLRLFDLYQQSKPRIVERYPVTIVEIDEESIAAYGQWPWPRDVLANLVDRISRSGPKVIGFDVLFAEPDRLSQESVARSLTTRDGELRRALERLPSNDRRLADSFKTNRVVLGLAILSKAAEPNATEPGPPAAPILERGTNARPFLRSYPALLRNIDVLSRESRGHGIVSLGLERDGVLRRIPVVARIGQNMFPAISVEMLRVAGGYTFVELVAGVLGVTRIKVGKFLAPTDRTGRSWIHYSGHPKRFVSARDVLSGNVDGSLFRDKLVLVGATAVGLGDFTATPSGGLMAGVEVHAQFIENILAGALLQRPALTTVLEICLTIFFGLLIISVQPRISLTWMIAMLVGLAAALGAGSWFAFSEVRVLVDPVYPLITAILLYVIVVSFGLIAEERNKRAIAEQAARIERESKERVQLLLDSTGEALYGIDAEGKCTFCNPACLRMLGFDAATDLTGRNMHELVHARHADGSDFPETECRIHAAFRSGVSAHEENDRIWREDGSSFPADARSFPIRDGEAVVGAVVTFIDISERKAAERSVQEREAKLRELQSELESVSRASAMSQLASALAHELNQPLTAIMNYIPVSQQALKGGDATRTEKSVEFMNKALDQARRASGIIKGLRDLTEKGEASVSGEDINTVVAEACELVRMSASDSRIDIRLDLQDDLPIVAINKIQIQQVVVNLVRNAIESMGDQANPLIEVRTGLNGDGSVGLAVTDNGSGIADGAPDRIFDPFISTKPHGMGLGLSICKSIVEAHMGRIWADFGDGGGATFRIALPVARKTVAEASPPSP
jgi:PAS domain S-box-containing protein